MYAQEFKVLLFEDNPGDTRLICEALSELRGGVPSFSVDCVTRLHEGLARLNEGGINVVLLDLWMPDSQGLETFTTVRAHAPDLPIVVLTGYNNDAVGVQAVSAGAQDYLIKGQLDPRLLYRALLYAIERTKLLIKIRALRGPLPICSRCKNVRSDAHFFKQLETYLAEHSEAEFSHGICPACLTKHYGNIEKMPDWWEGPSGW